MFCRFLSFASPALSLFSVVFVFHFRLSVFSSPSLYFFFCCFCFSPQSFCLFFFSSLPFFCCTSSTSGCFPPPFPFDPQHSEESYYLKQNFFLRLLQVPHLVFFFLVSSFPFLSIYSLFHLPYLPGLFPTPSPLSLSLSQLVYVMFSTVSLTNLWHIIIRFLVLSIGRLLPL